MKKLIFTSLLMLLSTAILFAQRGRDDKEAKHREIQAIKIGYITKKLNLTPEQAEDFWPIYNAFEKGNHELRMKFGKQYHKDNPNASRREAIEYINADINYQEQKLTLKKELIQSLKGKITEQQLADLFIAEREFRAMLLKRLHHKGGDNRGHKER